MHRTIRTLAIFALAALVFTTVAHTAAAKPRGKSKAARKTAPSKAARGKASPKKAAPTKAAAVDPKALSKPIKRVIGFIRYNKDAKALSQFDGPAQSAFLLGGSEAKFTPAQKTAFITSFHKLFAAIAFPRVRGDFQKLETILYDAPRISGNTATIGATIVILHPAKKQEIKATFDLSKAADGWKVVDVTIKGDKSMLTNIRNEQIRPLVKEGGAAGLLGLMSKRLAALSKS
jgi:phospholipid transport system substrate-binding protein